MKRGPSLLGRGVRRCGDCRGVNSTASSYRRSTAKYHNPCCSRCRCCRRSSGEYTSPHRGTSHQYPRSCRGRGSTRSCSRIEARSRSALFRRPSRRCGDGPERERGDSGDDDEALWLCVFLRREECRLLGGHRVVKRHFSCAEVRREQVETAARAASATERPLRRRPRLAGGVPLRRGLIAAARARRGPRSAACTGIRGRCEKNKRGDAPACRVVGVLAVM